MELQVNQNETQADLGSFDLQTKQINEGSSSSNSTDASPEFLEKMSQFYKKSSQDSFKLPKSFLDNNHLKQHYLAQQLLLGKKRKQIENNGIIIKKVLNAILDLQLSYEQEQQIKYSEFAEDHAQILDIHEQIEIWQNYLEFTENQFVMALKLIDKYIKTQNIKINYQNINKLLIVSLIIVEKFCNDIPSKNLMILFAIIEKVDIDTLKQLEIHFLESLNYQIYIDSNEFQQYKNTIINFNNNN